MFGFIDPIVIDLIAKMAIPNLIIGAIIISHRYIVVECEEKEISEARKTIQKLYQEN